MLQALATLLLAAAILIGCGNSSDPAGQQQADADPAESVATTNAPEPSPPGVGPIFVDEGNPELLSDWAQLSIENNQLVVDDAVTPYTLNSALFSDHASKLRTIWLPEGADAADYDNDDVFSFPVGTVITKTFYYLLPDGDPAASNGERRVTSSPDGSSDIDRMLDLSLVRLVETRVLAHRASGWVALPYVWDDEQTHATLSRTGDLQPMVFVDGVEETPFPYVVPNVNQCAGCHATNHTTGLIRPIGPKARHLNTDIDLGDGASSQLVQWSNLGLVTGLPELADIPRSVVWNDDTASVAERARAYLDINCAHCHNENGPADTSGLFLEPTTEVGPRLGVCKPPVAAGTGTGDRRVGISPGHPEDSIFVFRMTTTDPGAMMPELGRGLIHQDGVDIISEWIASLEGDCAN